MRLFGKKKNKPSQQAFAVVTGAGSGIGRSFALELAKRGGTVVCSDINLDAAKETVALIEAQGAKAFAVQCDVAKEEQVNQLAEPVAARGRCVGRCYRLLIPVHEIQQ